MKLSNKNFYTNQFGESSVTINSWTRGLGRIKLIVCGTFLLDEELITNCKLV